MRVTPFNVAFAFLALCGNGHAGPCKPKSTSAGVDGPSSTGGVTSASTQGTTSASTAVSTTAEESSAVEYLTSYSSSIISESVSLIITTTSDALLSYSTELSLSSETTETSDTTTTETSDTTTTETSATTASTTEVSTEPLTTSNTAETTTSEVPISTTTEGPAPSNLFSNPSFEVPSIDGEVDGTAWIVEDGPASSVRISPDIARTGSHSAYWSIATYGQNGGTIKQEISLENDHFYKLSYWWYIDEDVQPQNLQSCYITIEQQGTDGLTSGFPDFLRLPSPLPLKTWTKRELQFNSINISPAYMIFGALCVDNAGTGFKIAIDDIQLLY